MAEKCVLVQEWEGVDRVVRQRQRVLEEEGNMGLDTAGSSGGAADAPPATAGHVIALMGASSAASPALQVIVLVSRRVRCFTWSVCCNSDIKMRQDRLAPSKAILACLLDTKTGT